LEIIQSTHATIEFVSYINPTNIGISVRNACGVVASFGIGANEIADVDCPDCLKMYRRVYGPEKEPSE
jgi:hypothetical protein